LRTPRAAPATNATAPATAAAIRAVLDRLTTHLFGANPRESTPIVLPPAGPAARSAAAEFAARARSLSSYLELLLFAARIGLIRSDGQCKPSLRESRRSRNALQENQTALRLRRHVSRCVSAV
jgi:hypothetical protein